MSGPQTEDPQLPDPNPEWLARYEAKMADLMEAREERQRERERIRHEHEQFLEWQQRRYDERGTET